MSGLEVALRRFARAAKSDALQAHIQDGDAPSLASQVDRLGLAATLRYLIPLVLKEYQTWSADFKATSVASDLRNNVVHNGQREVNSDTVGTYLGAISRAASVLKDASRPDAV